MSNRIGITEIRAVIDVGFEYYYISFLAANIRIIPEITKFLGTKMKPWVRLVICILNNPLLSVICLGEKEISPKVLKITPRVLMITFGVSYRG